jgi:hypothetical protein
MELDLVCRCGRVLISDVLEKSSDRCPYCGDYIPAVVRENYRRRKSGEPDLVNATFELLEKATPLFSGAR